MMDYPRVGDTYQRKGDYNPESRITIASFVIEQWAVENQWGGLVCIDFLRSNEWEKVAPSDVIHILGRHASDRRR